MPLTRIFRVPKTADGRAMSAEITAVIALFVALVGSGITLYVSHVWNNHLESESHSRRILNADTELQLCQKVYGAFVSIERNAAAKISVSAYEKELPGISIVAIRNLVQVDKKSAAEVENDFRTSQCYSLPYVKATLLPNGRKKPVPIPTTGAQ